MELTDLFKSCMEELNLRLSKDYSDLSKERQIECEKYVYHKFINTFPKDVRNYLDEKHFEELLNDREDHLGKAGIDFGWPCKYHEGIFFSSELPNIPHFSVLEAVGIYTFEVQIHSSYFAEVEKPRELGKNMASLATVIEKLENKGFDIEFENTHSNFDTQVSFSARNTKEIADFIDLTYNLKR